MKKLDQTATTSSVIPETIPALMAFFKKQILLFLRVSSVLCLALLSIYVCDYFILVPTVDDLLDMGVYTMEPYKLENDYLGRPVIVLYKAKEGAPYVLECNKWLESRAQEAMQPEKTFKKRFFESLEYDAQLFPVEPDLDAAGCVKEFKDQCLFRVLLSILCFVWTRFMVWWLGKRQAKVVHVKVTTK